VCVGQGWVTPAEFWRLRPAEVWWLIDAKTPPEVIEQQETKTRLLFKLREAQAAERG